MLKVQSGAVLSCEGIEYSMKIIKPNPSIDNEIIKNTYDPNIDYKLRIINPYTKKEITGNKRPCFSPIQNKFQKGGKRYEVLTSR
jgi:hypothetical protein